MSSPSEIVAILRQGIAAAEAGQFETAERHYRAAHRMAPREASIAIGLGHVLRQLRRPVEAKALFEGVVTRNPALAEGHYALGLAQKDLQETAAAEISLRAALARDPKLATAALALGALYNATQRPEAALAVLADVQPTDPGLATAAVHTRAIAQQELGKFEEALTSLRQVVRDQPLHLAAHHALNQLLYRLGRDDEFLRSYDILPGQPHFALAKAAWLVRLDRAGEAVPLYRQVLQAAPGEPVVLQGLAAAQLKLGQVGDAITSYEAALARAPQDVNLLTGVGAAYLMAREADKAEAAAQRALTVAPHDQTGLCLLGTAWRLKGDAREHDLNRYDSFVQVIDLEPSPDIPDMPAFCAALDEALKTQHRDQREYADQSLRGGTQTAGALFDSRDPLITALRTQIEEAVQGYVARLPDDAYHPFLRRKSANLRFAGSWSSRLNNNGFHANHIHPEGWISSAFYVAVPDVAADAARQEGWLKFGEPGYDVGLNEPVRRTVQPVVGRLVLFPSYFWHGTIPFEAAQARTTVAFDVIPQA